MATTGNTSAAVNAVLTHPFLLTEIEERIKLRNPLYAFISKNVSKLGAVSESGDYVRLKRYTTDRQHAIAGRSEGGDGILPGTTTPAYATLYPMQIMGSIGWSHEQLENCRTERGFADLISGDFLAHINAVKGVLNACWFGDGTGRLARVASYSATSATVGVVTVDNDQADFGWNKCDLMFEGLMVDIYTVANIVGTSAWTTKVTQCVVSGVNKSAGTFTITARTDSAGNALAGSEITANPADSDFVFIHGAVKLTSANKWSAWQLPMGIHGIVDDGGSAGNEFNTGASPSSDYNHNWSGVTFQGLARNTAANSMFESRIARAGDNRGGTDGTAVTTDMNDIDLELDYLFQTNDGPDPEKLIALCNAKTGRWWTTTAAAEQNAFAPITDNRVVPGYKRITGFNSQAANAVIPVFYIPTCADGTIIFLDTDRLGFWDMYPLGPFLYGGKSQFESPGTRNLTNERWSRYRGNLGAVRCDTSLRIEDCDIA